MEKELRHKIERGELDINNMSNFFSILIKGFIYNLNNKIFLHGTSIPHYILNTGDDTMYLEVKGQDHSIEPSEVSNEQFVYSMIPRCVVNPNGIDVLPDQLTNPHTRGNLDIPYDGSIISFSSEYRRMPLKLDFSLKYWVDTFTDSLSVAQQIISKLMFIQTFSISYMGQNILCSYKMPENLSPEKNIEFDGGTTDQKARTISLDIEVETNFPVFDNRTVVENDLLIAGIQAELIVANSSGQDLKTIKQEKVNIKID